MKKSNRNPVDHLKWLIILMTILLPLIAKADLADPLGISPDELKQACAMLEESHVLVLDGYKGDLGKLRDAITASKNAETAAADQKLKTIETQPDKIWSALQASADFKNILTAETKYQTQQINQENGVTDQAKLQQIQDQIDKDMQNDPMIAEEGKIWQQAGSDSCYLTFGFAQDSEDSNHLTAGAPLIACELDLSSVQKYLLNKDMGSATNYYYAYDPKKKEWGISDRSKILTALSTHDGALVQAEKAFSDKVIESESKAEELKKETPDFCTPHQSGQAVQDGSSAKEGTVAPSAPGLPAISGAQNGSAS